MALPEWLDLDGRLTGLQELPVVLEFRSVDLNPGLDETLLRFRQAPAETTEGAGSKLESLQEQVRPTPLPGD